MKTEIERHGKKPEGPTSGACHRLSGLRFPGSGLCLPALICGLLVAGCNLPLPSAQPDLTRFYLLTTTEGPAEAEAAAPLKRWAVGVRTVDVAAYLRSQSLAVRSHGNEVAFPEFARWGEPIDQGIARVLAGNLQPLPNVARVATPPFSADTTRDFEVAVRVTACEGTADGDVRFAANWRVLAPGGSAAPVAEGSYTATGLRWDGHDHGQLAARLSEAVAGLSREIAAALPRETAK